MAAEAPRDTFWSERITGRATPVRHEVTGELIGWVVDGVFLPAGR